MEKKRVPKDERYWYINDCLYVSEGHERGICISEVHFIKGNYFHTKEEAESMASKLRAVLKGADVIEMLSEEEMKAKIKEVSNKTISDAATSFLGWINEMSSTFCEWAIESMINYLKSKIVK